MSFEVKEMISDEFCDVKKCEVKSEVNKWWVLEQSNKVFGSQPVYHFVIAFLYDTIEWLYYTVITEMFLSDTSIFTFFLAKPIIWLRFWL